jgi:hypothetical protein
MAIVATTARTASMISHCGPRELVGGAYGTFVGEAKELDHMLHAVRRVSPPV